MVGTLDDVVGALRRIDGALPRSDGLRYFNRLYIDVTSEVIALLASDHCEIPTFLERLDLHFANSYFAAIRAADSGAEISPPWSPLYESHGDTRVSPIQFALAGINAHINYDLPVGLVDTCVELDLDLDELTPQRRDFDRINDIMAAVEASSKRWLYGGILRWLDRLLGRVDDIVAIWSLERAREAAWTNARALLRLHSDGTMADEFKDTLARSVGLAGRGLLAPTRLPLPHTVNDRLSPRPPRDGAFRSKTGVTSGA
jgi:hypothetical protein